MKESGPGFLQHLIMMFIKGSILANMGYFFSLHLIKPFSLVQHFFFWYVYYEIDKLIDGCRGVLFSTSQTVIFSVIFFHGFWQGLFLLSTSQTDLYSYFFCMVARRGCFFSLHLKLFYFFFFWLT